MILVIFLLLVLSILVVLNLLLTFALIRRVNQRESSDLIEPLDVGDEAPHFEAETLSGRLVNSSSLVSRGYLMVFVSPECLPCASKIDEIADLVPKVEAVQKDLLLISNGNATETRELLAATTIIDPLLDASPDRSIWRDYKVPGTPFFYFFNDRRQVSASGFVGTDFALKVEAWLKPVDRRGSV